MWVRFPIIRQSVCFFFPVKASRDTAVSAPIERLSCLRILAAKMGRLFILTKAGWFWGYNLNAAGLNPQISHQGLGSGLIAQRENTFTVIP